MSDHPIEGMMSSTMEKIRQMVDVNTIIGDPITSPDGTVIIPVSKVTYGFAAGGSDFPTKAPSQKDLFGGGSGAGITISPVAFLAIHEGDVKLLQVEPFNSSADRMIGLVPEVVDKIGALFKKSGEKKSTRKSKKEDESVGGEVALQDPVI
ncbi:MAG: sporulation protein YtfJ [Clostridiales bacterium]|jgi:sporulation protein YtfJ|nr:sporulation protein YtfJ [Clostridiales bacterium]